jgi:ribosomal protein L32
MECPHCGEEMRRGEECKKCGKEVVPSNEMEVQYKEFKVSELLDIRMTSPVSTKEGMKNHEPAPGNKDGLHTAGQGEKEQKTRQSHILVLAIIAFLAAVAVFYLLKLL